MSRTKNMICALIGVCAWIFCMMSTLAAGSSMDEPKIEPFVPKNGDIVYDVYTDVYTADGALFAGKIVLRADQDIVKPSGADAIVNAANEGCLGGMGIDGVIHKAAGPRLTEFNATLPAVKKTKKKSQAQPVHAQAASVAPVRCPLGDARISPSFDLYKSSGKKIGFILSTTGPDGKNPDRADLIASCYRSCIELAGAYNLLMRLAKVSHNPAWMENMRKAGRISEDGLIWSLKVPSINTIIFPPISGGIFGYSVADSAIYVVPAIIESMQRYAQELQAIKIAKKSVAQELPEDLPPFTIILTFFKLGEEGPEVTPQEAIKIYQDLLQRAQDAQGHVRFPYKINPPKHIVDLRRDLQLIIACAA